VLAQVKAGADMPTAQFLLIGQGARAEAMGQSVVANCFDETATYWNPAAMSFVPNPVAGLSGANISENVTSNYAAFVYPYQKYGFGFRYLSMSSIIDNYDVYGNKLSQNLMENDSSISLLASYKLIDCLSVGLGVGNVSMKFTVPGTSLNADANNISLSALFKKNDLSFGACLSNLGGTIQLDTDAAAESMPQVLNIGGAVSLLENKNLNISAALENVANDANAGGMRMGGEYLFNKYFALRGGFIPVKNNNIETTLGFGLKYDRYGLDFAATIAPGEASDMNVFRLGFSVKFGDIPK
jgi:hypothetical protein